MNFDLSEAQQAGRARAGAIGRSLAAEAPATEAIAAAAHVGLLDPGVDLLGVAAAVEALAYEHASAAIALALHSSVLRGAGDPAPVALAQQVARLGQGTTVGALAMSSDDVPIEDGGRLTGHASSTWVLTTSSSFARSISSTRG